MQKWWRKTWQQKDIRIHIITKTKYQNLNWKHKHICKILCKNPSFKVNLNNSEDQTHSVRYLHNVKHTKFRHKPHIVRFVTNLDSCSGSFYSYLENTLHL
jgi:hypothetical protein